MIDSDDTTEGRLIIRSKRLVPRLAQVSALAHAAGVGMLEDRQRGRVLQKFADQICRRRGVENVVVRQRLAVQLFKVLVKFAVQPGALMWVLTVAQRLS